MPSQVALQVGDGQWVLVDQHILLQGYQQRADGVLPVLLADAIPKAMGFSESETPCFVGRAVAALAADPNVHEKTGQVLASWTLAREYGFTDIDGRRPDWWAFLEQSIGDLAAKGGPETDEEKYWVQAWHTQLKDQPEHQALVTRIAELLP